MYKDHKRINVSDKKSGGFLMFFSLASITQYKIAQGERQMKNFFLRLN